MVSRWLLQTVFGKKQPLQTRSGDQHHRLWEIPACHRSLSTDHRKYWLIALVKRSTRMYRERQLGVRWNHADEERFWGSWKRTGKEKLSRGLVIFVWFYAGFFGFHASREIEQDPTEAASGTGSSIVFCFYARRWESEKLPTLGNESLKTPMLFAQQPLIVHPHVDPQTKMCTRRQEKVEPNEAAENIWIWATERSCRGQR